MRQKEAEGIVLPSPLWLFSPQTPATDVGGLSSVGRPGFVSWLCEAAVVEGMAATVALQSSCILASCGSGGCIDAGAAQGAVPGALA